MIARDSVPVAHRGPIGVGEKVSAVSRVRAFGKFAVLYASFCDATMALMNTVESDAL